MWYNLLMDTKKLFSTPVITSEVRDLLEAKGITPTRFVSTVESFGGSRKAAHQLTQGIVPQGMHALTMLVVAYVLEESVDALFALEYEYDDEPLSKESYREEVQEVQA